MGIACQQDHEVAHAVAVLIEPKSRKDGAKVIAKSFNVPIHEGSMSGKQEAVS